MKTKMMSEYKTMHDYYSKTDGFLAIAVYAVNMLLLFAAGLAMMNFQIRLFVPASILGLALIFVVLLLRKQHVRTIGIGFSLRSVLIGLGSGLLFFLFIWFLRGASIFGDAFGGEYVPGWTPEIIIGGREVAVLEWVPLAALFIIITTIHQEILIRGFVQTRLRGLFSSEIVAIVVGGVLFVLFFIPIKMLIMNQSFAWILGSMMPIRLTWMFALHVLLSFMYRAYNNISAPILFHIFFSFHNRVILALFTHVGFGHLL